MNGLAIPALQPNDTLDLIALDRALSEMETIYPRVGQVVELKYLPD